MTTWTITFSLWSVGSAILAIGVAFAFGAIYGSREAFETMRKRREEERQERKEGLP